MRQSKFYFFDCGVVRSLSGRLPNPPTPEEFDFLKRLWDGEVLR